MWVSSVGLGNIAAELPAANWRWCALPLGEAFVLSLGTNGRLWSSGTTASTLCHLPALMGSTQEQSAWCNCRLWDAQCWHPKGSQGEWRKECWKLLFPYPLSLSLEICYWWHKKSCRIHLSTPVWADGQSRIATLLSCPAAFLKFTRLSFPFCIHLLMIWKWVKMKKLPFCWSLKGKNRRKLKPNVCPLVILTFLLTLTCLWETI